MSDLPKVFVNKIDNIINNEDEVLISNSNRISLDDIFDNNKYLFNHRYLITLKNGREYNTSIIARRNNKVLTIDNDLININDILNIREIKK